MMRRLKIIRAIKHFQNINIMQFPLCTAHMSNRYRFSSCIASNFRAIVCQSYDSTVIQYTREEAVR